MKKIALLLLSLAVLPGVKAQISLPSVFGDNMVLQQNSDVPVWGWGNSSEIIRIVGSWAPQDTVKVLVANDGRWQTTIPTVTAGGPYELSIWGSSRKTLTNIMLGEVWLCSGQSNMEWTPSMGIKDQAAEITDANHPQIRFFSVRKQGDNYPQNNCEAQWEICSPETMPRRSAVAYFFARRLQEVLDVPVGLMISAWGGTPAEVWVKKEVIESNEAVNAGRPADEKPWWPHKSGVLYNQMIHPLVPYRIAGAIWYQGESNQNRYPTYDAVMKELIGSWRRDFGHDFPFYFVQIAPFAYNAKDRGPALLREQQEKTSLEVPRTGMVVTMDLVDDVKNIHPLDKQNVGLRLANMALVNDYGQHLEGIYSPTFDAMELDRSKAVIRFRNAGEGLVCRGKSVVGLKIAGADGIWFDAMGKIEGDKLMVYSPKVKSPVTVTYCFDEATIGNLFGRNGLPVASFRTDREF